MLVEGVDFPWLRWICLRRQVKSRVRFIQELGRVLRASPGKDKARVLDPNDLFGEFQLTYADALGLLFADAPEEDEDTDAENEEDKECKENERPAEEIQTARTNALGRYVREVRLALLAEGIAKDKQLAGRLWRNHAPTDKQLGWIEKLKPFLRYVCIEHSTGLQQVSTYPNLTKGLVCDMIDILSGLKDGLKAGKLPNEWVPSMKIRVPCADAFMPVLVAPAGPVPVYVTGTMDKENAAIALMRGGAVLYVMARHRKPGDNWTRLTKSAIQFAVNQYQAEEVVTDDQDAFDTFSGSEGCNGVGVRLIPKAENPSVGPAWGAIKRAAVSS
jgi:hypothetical protein